MMACVSVHPSNPFRPMTSEIGRFQNLFDGKLSSLDPICGFDVAETPATRRLSRRAERLNHPVIEEEDDELLLTNSSQRAAQLDTTDQQQTDPERDEEQTDQDYASLEEVEQYFEEPMDEDGDEGCESLDSDDEENSLQRKPHDEQQEIKTEISELISLIPGIDTNYRIFDRLGTGTFSSVYKAQDLFYHEMINTPWHGHHPVKSSAHYQSQIHEPGSTVYVAIKRIYVTSNPERIRNEIDILETIRGCRHVSQLITAFRNEDQVVVVIPYQRNIDFRDFMYDLPWKGIRDYFRCLFRALRDVHSRDIIHRDVKPANFLFDPERGTGTLCDFGLASRVDYDSFQSTSMRSCNHTIPTREEPHGKTRRDVDKEKIKSAQLEARKRSSMPSDRIGYPADDRRPQLKVNRAGTRGFRAPEVLLKCPEQTTAVDIWSAGIILLFFLCGRIPLFHSNDDTEALMEIAAIIGKYRMERVAALHGRVFISNVPSVKQATPWRDFCSRYNETLYTTGPPAQVDGDDDSDTEGLELVEDRKSQVDNALDLLEHLLDPDCTIRYDARQALHHPWLREDRDPEYDDECFPHPLGQGICAALHYQDETGRNVAFVGNTPRVLEGGEGIAIGHSPCEFHKDVDIDVHGLTFGSMAEW